VRLADVARVLARLRTGKRVVLANGCFDILHVGHIRYLQAARQAGDLLVVAVNDDESVRRLKGPGRPILPGDERLRLVKAVAGVDVAFLFSGDDLRDVLTALRPDVHAKGTDYTEESVPERETTRALGGVTRIVGDPKGHSSTDLIQRVLRAGEGPRGRTGPNSPGRR
jgi:rfaE bifunctional protein nucleotidyltransferase chain/domain